MRVALRWTLAVLIAAGIVGVPTAYYRATYAHAKRLREVSPGKVYRCGQLTANGFREAIRRYGIRTVVNLQEEARDPFLPETWQKSAKLTESELCQELGVRYISLDGGVIAAPGPEGLNRPRVIDDFLEILDDPANHPVLFHCKAGLHRTGLLAAVYRIEYEGWTIADAVRELRANGFGTYAATEDNIYLVQFLQHYQRGQRRVVKPRPGSLDEPASKPAPPIEESITAVSTTPARVTPVQGESR